MPSVGFMRDGQLWVLKSTEATFGPVGCLGFRVSFILMQTEMPTVLLNFVVPTFLRRDVVISEKYFLKNLYNETASTSLSLRSTNLKV